MLEGEASKQKYKLVEYKDVIYEIPIRKVDDNQQQILLWSDVLSLIPKATCCLNNSKLIPFQLDQNLNELTPKRILLSSTEEEETVWEIHVPDYTNGIILDQLNSKLDYLIQHQLDQQDRQSIETDTSNSNNDNIPTVHTNNNTNNNITTAVTTNHASSSASSASSSSAVAAASTSSTANNTNTSTRQEAPPSYETSMLSTIHALTSKLRLFESHIPNRHKSPKWLSNRDAWMSQEPNSIEEIAYLLVQLEMALLWTAVTESWIEERETWLTLVANSRSERHLAGAILNLERHTLVLDESWSTIRERWINELLEMVVLPLSHG